jgi:hypothetical protein
VTEVNVDTLIAKFDRTRFNQMSARTRRAMLLNMGRNLLLFNQIEGCLKRVLPYIHPEAGAQGGDELRQFRESLRKKTLGQIVQPLLEAISPDVDGLEQYVRSVVDHRNALVHHFLDQPGVALSEEGAREGIRWLDEQHKHCEPLLALCSKLLVACLYGMERVAEARGEALVVPEWRSA